MRQTELRAAAQVLAQSNIYVEEIQGSWRVVIEKRQDAFRSSPFYWKADAESAQRVLGQLAEWASSGREVVKEEGASGGASQETREGPVGQETGEPTDGSMAEIVWGVAEPSGPDRNDEVPRGDGSVGREPPGNVAKRSSGGGRGAAGEGRSDNQPTEEPTGWEGGAERETTPEERGAPGPSSEEEQRRRKWRTQEIRRLLRALSKLRSRGG